MSDIMARSNAQYFDKAKLEALAKLYNIAFEEADGGKFNVQVADDDGTPDAIEVESDSEEFDLLCEIDDKAYIAGDEGLVYEVEFLDLLPRCVEKPSETNLIWIEAGGGHAMVGRATAWGPDGELLREIDISEIWSVPVPQPEDSPAP